MLIIDHNSKTSNHALCNTSTLTATIY